MRDTRGLLRRRMEEAVDGEYQNFKAKAAATPRALLREVSRAQADGRQHERRRHLAPQPGRPRSAQGLRRLRQAVAHRGQPTVILAKTVKGYGMGDAGEGQNVTHQQKKMGRTRFGPSATGSRSPSPTIRSRTLPSTARPRKARRPCTCTSAAGPSADSCPPGRTGRPGSRSPASRSSRVRSRAAGPGGLDHDGLRAAADRPPPRPERRTPGRADRSRRGAHVRNGRPVPPARDLLVQGPALRAPGRRPAHVLPRGRQGPDPRGGDQRGRGLLVLDRRRHVVFEPRPDHDPVLHLLLDVRIPADRGPRLGGRRPPGPRLPPRGDGGPDDPGRGRAPALRRPQPHPRLEHSELRGLRSDLRLRARGHHARGPEAHDGGEGERLLLHHGDERELRPPRAAGGLRGRDPEGAVPAARRVPRTPAQARRTGPTPRFGGDPSRGNRGRRAAGGGLRRRERALGCDELHRAPARRPGRGSVEPAAPGPAPRTSQVERCLGGDDAPVVAATDYVKLYADQVREFVPAPYTASGRTGSGGATSGRRCAATSRWTATSSPSRRSRPSRTRAGCRRKRSSTPSGATGSIRSGRPPRAASAEQGRGGRGTWRDGSKLRFRTSETSPGSR